MEYNDKHKRILNYISKLELPFIKTGFNIIHTMNFEVSKKQVDINTWFQMERNELIDFLKSRSANQEVEISSIDRKLLNAEIKLEESFYVHFLK